MDSALTLKAPPTMFDELEVILKQSDYSISLLSSDNVIRGVRRMDTARYDITHGHTSVQLWVEHRIGNPTMFISIVPRRKSILRRDVPSNRLAEQIVELLVAHGADNSG